MGSLHSSGVTRDVLVLDRLDLRDATPVARSALILVVDEPGAHAGGLVPSDAARPACLLTFAVKP
jgi:hypothetical protein